MVDPKHVLWDQSFEGYARILDSISPLLSCLFRKSFNIAFWFKEKSLDADRGLTHINDLRLKLKMVLKIVWSILGVK